MLFSPMLRTACCSSLLMIAGTALVQSSNAAAQQVYQWKDAQGRTHYSSTPPKSGNYQVRGVGAQPSAQPSAPTESKAESAQCKQARANLGVLRAGGPVQMNDGDGTPRMLSDEQRAAQIKLAETVLETNCKSDN
ncbi:MAG: DUF4124 domain-containing protein [Pseudomonadota bacterium]|nr:DUF4124 domain-containing protein [Pseudomonadota bacterium]